MQEQEIKQAIKDNYSKLTRFCRRYFGNADDTHDAVQEILLKVWKNRDSFRGEASITTWMFRIAANVCLTTLQYSKRQVRLDDLPSLPDANDQYVDETAEVEERERKLKFFEQFMSSINPADRILVNLYVEDIDAQGISAVTGLSEVNVRTRIHRIRKQIKKEWEAQNGLG